MQIKKSKVRFLPVWAFTGLTTLLVIASPFLFNEPLLLYCSILIWILSVLYSLVFVSQLKRSGVYITRGNIVIQRATLWGTQDDNIRLVGIEDVTVQEGKFWQSILGYGSLEIQADGMVKAVIPYVKDPHKVMQYILQLVEKG